MKEFKKRFAEHCDCTESCSIDDYEMGCGRCKDIREEGWRWAFESIRNKIQQMQDTKQPMSILEIVAFIDEELNE